MIKQNLKGITGMPLKSKERRSRTYYLKKHPAREKAWEKLKKYLYGRRSL